MVISKQVVLCLALCGALAACKSDEERAQEHLLSAQALLEEGDSDRAVVELRNALQLQPANLAARRQMAEINLERGRKRGAYRDFLAVVEKEPDDLRGRVVLSNIAFETRSWDEFERHGTRAVELAPEDPEVQAISLGLQYRDAVEEENTSAQLDLTAAAEVLAETLPDNNILREMRLREYVLRRDYEKALVLVDQNIAENPDELELRSGKIQILTRMEDFEALESELRTVVQLFPEESAPKQTLLRFLLSRDRIADAEAFLRQLVAESPEDQRDGYYNDLIRFLIQTQGAEAGLAELNAGLAARPENDTLRALRGSINFDAGRQDEGISELEAVLAKETSTLSVSEKQRVSVTLARMLLTQGNEVGARKLVEDILAGDPNAVDALKMRANWLIEEDNTDEAITVLRTALDQAPQDAEALSLMAKSYQRAGNPDLMRDFLSLAVEASNNDPEYALPFATALLREDKPLQAEATLISALRLSPQEPEILRTLGIVYLQIDDLQRAQQVVRALANIEGDTARQYGNQLQVEILGRESGFSEAVDFLNQLAAQDGREGEFGKLTLLQTQLRSGQLEAAQEYGRSLVEEEPDNYRFRSALALTYAAAQNFEAAEAELDIILERRPQLSSVWLQLIRIRAAGGDDAGAKATILDALEANPGDPELLWVQASYKEKEGDVDGAIAIYEDLYENHSESLLIANNLASLLGSHRQDADSLERAYQIARRLRGTDVPAFQDTYGWLLHRRGDTEEALPYLEASAQALSRDPVAISHLGYAYAAVNRPEDALTQLRRALEVAGPLGAGDPQMQDVREKVEELEAAVATPDLADN